MSRKRLSHRHRKICEQRCGAGCLYKLGSAQYNLKNWSAAAPAFDRRRDIREERSGRGIELLGRRKLAPRGDATAARSRYEAFVKQAVLPTPLKS
jgi:hypothetical protein